MKRKRKLFWWITSSYGVLLTWSGYIYWAFLANSTQAWALPTYLMIMGIGSVLYVAAIVLIQFGEE